MAAIERVVIGPNKGPQSEAFASSATITVYGGQAGGGKTYLTLLRFAVHAHKYPGYAATIFRREMPMVLQAGGMWEESHGLYPAFGAKPNESKYFWRWPNRSMVQFRSLQYESDKIGFQGAQFAEFCLEEATHFEESQFWYMFSRLRTKCGLRARCMLTCNPDPDSWVRRLIDWWIGEDGLAIRERAGKKRYFVREGDELIWGDTAQEVREKAPHIVAELDAEGQPISSLRFIPATLGDNPKGDRSYRSRLANLPRVERERLLGGNWNIRHAAGNVFNRAWFEVIDHQPSDIVRIVRAWDRAATEPNSENKDPDWTRGVKVGITSSGLYIVLDVVSMRARAQAVDELVKRTTEQDGQEVTQCFWRDPGAAGKAEEDRTRSMLAGYILRFQLASKDKLTYARAAATQADPGAGGGYGKIKLVRGPWNDAYLAEHHAFPTKGVHDDIVDGNSLAFIELSLGIQDTGPVAFLIGSDR